MNLLWELFFTFAKIGLFTFGGGYAMLALISDTCVDKKKWITDDEMMNITVIAESTPGPVAINCATYVGYKQKGIPGAIMGTLGMMLPSLVIIYLISLFLDDFLQIAWIANAFHGIKLGVGVIIVGAAVKMLKKMKQKKPVPIAIMLAAAVIMLLIDILSIKFSSVSLMLSAGAVSLALFALRELLQKKKKPAPENGKTEGGQKE